MGRDTSEIYRDEIDGSLDYGVGCSLAGTRCDNELRAMVIELVWQVTG